MILGIWLVHTVFSEHDKKKKGVKLIRLKKGSTYVKSMICFPGEERDTIAYFLRKLELIQRKRMTIIYSLEIKAFLNPAASGSIRHRIVKHNPPRCYCASLKVKI